MAFSRSFISEKLQAAGFKNIEVTFKDFLLPGVPNWMISPLIVAGNILEKTPIKYISQSILIKASTA